MHTLFATSIALALSAGAADPAPTNTGTVEKPQPVVQTVEEEKVCKMHREIGSNRAKRVCVTKSEMERQRKHAQEQLSNPARGG
jgi:hypothetical protein